MGANIVFNNPRIQDFNFKIQILRRLWINWRLSKDNSQNTKESEKLCYLLKPAI